MKKLLTTMLIATLLSFSFACGSTETSSRSSLSKLSRSSKISASVSEQTSTESSAENSSSATTSSQISTSEINSSEISSSEIGSSETISSQITSSETVSSATQEQSASPSIESSSSLSSSVISSSLESSSSSENAQLPPNSSQVSSSSTEISSESLTSSSLSVENTTSSTASSATSTSISTSSSSSSLNSSSSAPIDYGSLTIDSVSVDYNKTATITPKFSTTAGESAITYSYDTSKITISGNTVTGKMAGAVVSVTATTAHHSTTFTVTVGADYTFTVANITTYQNFYEIPTPAFTVPANAQEVTYTTTSSNISISGNKITGVVANSTATVTATTSKGTSATFTVTVGDNTFFNNIFNSAEFLTYFNTLQTNLDNKTGIDKNDLTLYIGDSFFDYRNFFTSAFNAMYSGANADTWEISSSMAEQWIYFIQKTYKYNPTKMVIHIGTNDIFDGYGSGARGKNLLSSATQGSANYNTIVNSVTATLEDLFNKIHTNLPNTKVYWYSIEPRIGSGDANGNAIATAVNSNILSFINSNSTWIKYLDSSTIFASDTSLYYDTVHPNLAGYTKMAELLPNDAVSSYTSYQATQTDFTHTNVTYAASTVINGAYGDFVYTSDVTINSTTLSNAHITLNFNHNSSYRFLLWDNQNANKFWFGGIFNGAGAINGGAGAQSYIDSTYLPISFKLTILSKDNKQYLFIEDNLAAVYSNSYFPRYLTVGAENCGVTFANNTVAHSGTTLYSTYANKVSSVSVSSVFTTYAISNITTSAPLTVNTITTASTTGITEESSAEILTTGQTFLFTGTLTINSVSAGNAHVSLSVGTDHDTSHRFLIWDFDGNGSYYFGYGPTYTSTSKAYFNYTAGMSLEISVLSTSKNAYLFVNGALQTVFAEKGNCTLLYATQNMATTLSNGCIYSSSAQLYNNYLEAVTTYENGSYTAGSAIDVGGEVVVSSTYNFAEFTKSGTVANKTTLNALNGSFVFESTVSINSYSTNGHISLEFNSSTTTALNRFLIWDNDSNGIFNFGGAYNSGHGNGSGSINATTKPKTFSLAVYVSGTVAYMFIDGELKTVLSLGFTVESMSFAAENCEATFTNNKIGNTIVKATTFTSYASKSGVSTYSSIAVGLYDHTNNGTKLA